MASITKIKFISKGFEEILCCPGADEACREQAARIQSTANGMNRFNKEGIQAFVGALSETGLAGVASRFGQLCEADKADVFYGGKLASATGDSRIVFKTGAVKTKEESKSSSNSKSKTKTRDCNTHKCRRKKRTNI